jgi:mRNA interferase YafQ
MADRPLPARYRDHALIGFDGVRDCHLKPDLILLYDKPDEDTLRLVRLGSHSELGL